LFNNNTYYKIGITNKLDIKDRFKSDWNKFNMQVLWSKQMSGDNVKILEQFILSKYKNNKVNLNILASGNTEILNVPIPLQELDSYVL
jgi:Na+-transporting NADH:ubiquinone oxidoreductase subunit NqrF